MDSRDEVPTGIHGGCDESKCASKGRNELYGGSLTCYGDEEGSFYPMMCADGYLPVVVDDEPTSLASSPSGDIDLSYFTCCPPYYQSSNVTDDTRHCSNPIAHNGESPDTVCGNLNTQKYPREMKPCVHMVWDDVILSKTDSFLCCDSIPTIGDGNEDNYSTINGGFLDEVECVPYKNLYYEPAVARNEFGRLSAIWCYFPDGSFTVPRALSGGIDEGAASTGRYQCCKDGPALDAFFHDSAFNTTVYPLLVLNCVAAVLSTLVAVGLGIPFLIEWKNGRYQNSAYQRSKSSRRGGTAGYSTFNLYLVYLALADLVWILCGVYLYGSTVTQKSYHSIHGGIVTASHIIVFDAFPVDFLIFWSYVLANMSINAIIAHEIFLLLRASHRAQRIKLPSLTRVNVQVGFVFLISATFGVAIHVLVVQLRKLYKNGNAQQADTAGLAVIKLITALQFPSLVYVICVSILSWWRGYIPNIKDATLKGRACRQLLFYFLRVVATFFVAWVPAICLILVGKHFVMAYCIMAIQPMLTFGMILTKPDAKKYIWDLVTLSYLFDRNGKASANTNKTGRTTLAPPTPDISTTENVSREDDDGGDDSEILCISVLGISLRDSVNHDNDAKTDAKANLDATATENCEDEGDDSSNIYATKQVRTKPLTLLFTGETVSVDSPSLIRSTAARV